ETPSKGTIISNVTYLEKRKNYTNPVLQINRIVRQPLTWASKRMFSTEAKLGMTPPPELPRRKALRCARVGLRPSPAPEASRRSQTPQRPDRLKRLPTVVGTLP